MRPTTAILVFFLMGVALIPVQVEASLLYSADFSTSNQGFSHHLLNPPAAGPQSTTGGSNSGVEGRWTASYASTPDTDLLGLNPNRFATSGGQMLIEDWGGIGTFESHTIDVSGQSFVDIQGINAVLLNGADSGGEYFRFFYQLDGGSAVYQDYSAGGTYNVSSLNVSGASSLSVGFTFNVDGGSILGGSQDGWAVSSLTVNTTPVPEPSTLLLSALMAGFGLYCFMKRQGWALLGKVCTRA